MDGERLDIQIMHICKHLLVLVLEFLTLVAGLLVPNILFGPRMGGKEKMDNYSDLGTQS